VFVVAPLLHVGTHLALAIFTGDRPYRNVEQLSLRTKFTSVISLFSGDPGVLGTWLWFVAVPGALIVAIAAARRRERDAWLLSGVLLTGYLMSAVELARGPTPSRYYIPWVVAVAAVAFRGLCRASIGRQVAVALVAVGSGLIATPAAISEWTLEERSGSTAVELSKRIVTAGCPLYLANFDSEQRLAIPQFFRFVRAEPMAGCRAGSPQAYAVSWKEQRLPLDFRRRCRSGWRTVAIQDRVSVLHCASLRRGAVPDQIAASGRPLVTVVRVRVAPRAPIPKRLFQQPAA